MYIRTLSNAQRTRRFTISKSESGWEVLDEQDSQVLRNARYDDWHRVERAKMAFALEAARLEDAGWTDYSTKR